MSLAIFEAFATLFSPLFFTFLFLALTTVLQILLAKSVLASQSFDFCLLCKPLQHMQLTNRKAVGIWGCKDCDKVKA
ncbi:hypothetical protein F2Q70_00037518 [Brassica cretica]|uniref:Uncharacterized protein n=1 Tax=Brassica cretica TaxID=69181 RepID=A0A8S9K0L9_BRACR|nr:hypothetical protein F2Q70_00037518 [Brassica cretica]